MTRRFDQGAYSILRRCPVRPDTDRLYATEANVAMGQ